MRCNFPIVYGPKPVLYDPPNGTNRKLVVSNRISLCILDMTAFYSLLKIYNFRNIVHFLKSMLQVVDNAVFWQNVLLYFENDPLSPSF